MFFTSSVVFFHFSFLFTTLFGNRQSDTHVLCFFLLHLFNSDYFWLHVRHRRCCIMFLFGPFPYNLLLCITNGLWFLGLSVYLESGYGNKLSSPLKLYIQNLLKVAQLKNKNSFMLPNKEMLILVSVFRPIWKDHMGPSGLQKRR